MDGAYVKNVHAGNTDL
ncbi:MAG: hypothetical protein ACLTDX_18075 [[Clostridium] innocuum]